MKLTVKAVISIISVLSSIAHSQGVYELSGDSVVCSGELVVLNCTSSANSILWGVAIKDQRFIVQCPIVSGTSCGSVSSEIVNCPDNARVLPGRANLDQRLFPVLIVRDPGPGASVVQLRFSATRNDTGLQFFCSSDLCGTPGDSITLSFIDEPPGYPQSLRANLANCSQLEVSWLPPEPDAGTVDTYRVWGYPLKPEACEGRCSFSVSRQFAGSVSINDLQPAAYRIGVSARNCKGSATRSITFSTVPETVDVNAEPVSCDQVRLSWNLTENPLPAQSYSIFRSGIDKPVANTSAGSQLVTVPAEPDSELVSFTVVSSGECGTGSTGSAIVDLGELRPAPENLLVCVIYRQVRQAATEVQNAVIRAVWSQSDRAELTGYQLIWAAGARRETRSINSGNSEAEVVVEPGQYRFSLQAVYDGDPPCFSAESAASMIRVPEAAVRVYRSDHDGGLIFTVNNIPPGINLCHARLNDSEVTHTVPCQVNNQNQSSVHFDSVAYDRLYSFRLQLDGESGCYQVEDEVMIAGCVSTAPPAVKPSAMASLPTETPSTGIGLTPGFCLAGFGIGFGAGVAIGGFTTGFMAAIIGYIVWNRAYKGAAMTGPVYETVH
ncbi:MAG: hypothetical protein ACR2PT_22790 [Endozoicomonas sp.]